MSGRSTSALPLHPPPIDVGVNGGLVELADGHAVIGHPPPEVGRKHNVRPAHTERISQTTESRDERVEPWPQGTRSQSRRCPAVGEELLQHVVSSFSGVIAGEKTDLIMPRSQAGHSAADSPEPGRSHAFPNQRVLRRGITRHAA